MIDVSDIVFRPPDHGIDLELLSEGEGYIQQGAVVADDQSQTGASSRKLDSSRSSPSVSTTKVVEYEQLKHTEHNFTLKTIDEQPYLTLQVKSWAPNPTSMPYFLEGQPISGRVELNLYKPDRIQEVLVLVKGLVICSGIEYAQFFKKTQTLWRGRDGRSPLLPLYWSYQYPELEGSHSWPFSLFLPRQVEINEHAARLLDMPIIGVQTLPPNLGMKGWPSCINYELQVVIKRKGVFKPQRS